MRTAMDVLKDHYGSDIVDRMQAAYMERDDWNTRNLVKPPEEWTKVKFPYEAPSHPPLPSLDEIDEALDKNCLNRRDPYTHHQTVCRVRNFVVKRGLPNEALGEAENLLYLEQFPQVNSPKVYAVHFAPISRYGYAPNGDGKDRFTYIIMEDIKGEPFEWEDWVQLPEDLRKLHTTRLGEQLKALRSIPSEGYYGRINNQPWYPNFPIGRTRGKTFTGPYTSYEALVDAIYISVELYCARNTGWATWPVWPASFLTAMPQLKGVLLRTPASKPVLTQLRFDLRNFVTRPVRNDEGKIVDYVITFVDLLDLAWCPAFMQRMCCIKQVRPVEPSDEEEAWWKMLEPYICEEDDSEVTLFLEEHFSNKFCIG